MLFGTLFRSRAAVMLTVVAARAATTVIVALVPLLWVSLLLRTCCLRR